MNNEMNNEQIVANNPSALAPKQRKKNMTEVALGANRHNAQKSTGPRTATGKARSDSNAFQHGLYSMRNFIHLQLRFLQMENVLNQYLLESKHDAPDRAYLPVLRELDLIRERGTTRKIEPIEGPPPVQTPEEYAK